MQHLGHLPNIDEGGKGYFNKMPIYNKYINLFVLFAFVRSITDSLFYQESEKWITKSHSGLLYIYVVG